MIEYIELLRTYISERDVAPTILGISIKPTIAYVLGTYIFSAASYILIASLSQVKTSVEDRGYWVPPDVEDS